MSTDLFTLEFADDAPTALQTLVIAFDGREALGALYEYQLTFALVDPTEDAIQFVLDAPDTDAAVVLGFRDAAGSEVGRRCGVFAAVELAEELPGDAASSAPALVVFRATLVPRLWRLTLTRRSGVFVGRSLKEIAEAALAREGFRPGADYALPESGAFATQKYDFVCQYQESDQAFLARRLEREGCFFFFDHTGPREKLVVATTSTTLGPAAPAAIPVLAGGDLAPPEFGAFNVFAARSSRRARSVRVRDYQHGSHSAPMAVAMRAGAQVPASSGLVQLPAGQKSASAAAADAVERAHDTLPEVQRFGENTLTEDEAKRLAQARLDASAWQARTYRGRGAVFTLGAGQAFALEVSPRGSDETTFVAVELAQRGANFGADPRLAALADPRAQVEHGRHAKHPQHAHHAAFVADVTAIPRSTVYRPECATPVPRILGMETATVEQAVTDPYGAVDKSGYYRVRFHFDQTGTANAQASAPVPMMQPFAGMGSQWEAPVPGGAGATPGFHIPLHRNTEVLVAFLGGDPDRPVITGAMPTRIAPGPVTDAHASRSVVQTVSGNLLQMEDELGKQRVTLSSPPSRSYLELGFEEGGKANFELHTERDGELNAGRDFKLEAGRDYDMEVGRHWNIEVGKDHTLHVGKEQQEMVIGNTMEGFIGNKFEGNLSNFDGLTVGTTGEVFIGGRFEASIAAAAEVFVGDKAELRLGNLAGAVLGTDTQLFVGLANETYVAGKAEMFVGAVVETFVGGKVETNVALKTETNIAGVIETNIAAKVETNLAATLETNIAAVAEINVAAKSDVTLGATLEIFAGLALELAGSIKIETYLAQMATGILSYEDVYVGIDQVKVKVEDGDVTIKECLSFILS